jgi:hypothetical protein
MENEMIWILSEFRQNKIDLSETILRIERLYAGKLGLVHPRDVAKELDAIEESKNES